MPALKNTLYTLEKNGVEVDLGRLPSASDEVEKKMKIHERGGFLPVCHVPSKLNILGK